MRGMARRFGRATLWAGLAGAAFVLVGLAYLIKLVSAPDSVVAEFRHPIAGNLFGTLLISLLLLPILLVPYAPVAARVMWGVGAVGMFAFAWVIVSRWMSDRQLVAHATPAWIVPVVGLLDVPLAVPSLGLPPLHGVMMAALAVGLFFAVPLFTLIFSRLVFEAPMPDALQPTLLILVAPFSVGFSAYVTTVGRVDLFAQALFALSLFVLAVLLGRLRLLLACCPFRVSWWAVSFPLAATAVAALRFAEGRSWGGDGCGGGGVAGAGDGGDWVFGGADGGGGFAGRVAGAGGVRFFLGGLGFGASRFALAPYGICGGVGALTFPKLRFGPLPLPPKSGRGDSLRRDNTWPSFAAFHVFGEVGF